MKKVQVRNWTENIYRLQCNKWKKYTVKYNVLLETEIIIFIPM